MKASTALAEDVVARPASPWRLYGAVWTAVVVAILLLFHRTAGHLFWIWWNNSTFGHSLLLPPILAWLVWQRKEGLAQLAPKPWLPGAALMLGAGVIWLLGELAGVSLVRHAALVLLLMATVPTVLGLAVTRALTFPMFFALFMIPVGEQLVPYLQMITAKFCIALLQLFDVPAYIDGTFISIPNGDFHVAEACSGVRFLIAMVAFGALVSNVCFISWKRRIAFMAASIIVPIIANGLRAWGTIYIAHLTTAQFAAGVDHVIYGWFFFAFVLALTLAIGWRFFDRPVDDPFIDPAMLQPPARRVPAPASVLLTAAVIAIAVAAAAPAYAAFATSRTPDRATQEVVLPTPPGWTRIGTGGTPWEPRYNGATAKAFASYIDANGQPVDLYVAVFDKQSDGAELVGYQQGVVPPSESETNGWAWAGNQPAPAGALGAQINYGSVARDVWQFYWVNGKLVGSPYAAKVEKLKAQLFGGQPRAATVVIAAQRVDSMVSARPALERFTQALGPVDTMLARAIVTGEGR